MINSNYNQAVVKKRSCLPWNIKDMTFFRIIFKISITFIDICKRRYAFMLKLEILNIIDKVFNKQKNK
jgi:hypothetical protein